MTESLNNREPERQKKTKNLKCSIIPIMVEKFLYIASLLATVFLISMMNLTTPQSVGPFGVLVFFTTFYVACLGIIVGILKFIYWTMNRGRQGKKIYYYAMVLAFAPVILVAIGSFGGIGILEVALVALMMTVGCFIISKRI